MSLRVSIIRISPPSDEGAGCQWQPLSVGLEAPTETGDETVARLRRDGGRESALIKPFLTTPQSAPQTAPLTRGAGIWPFDRLRALPFSVMPLNLISY